MFCLIISHYWKNIQSVESHDTDCKFDPVNPCGHEWKNLTLEEFHKAKKQFIPHRAHFNNFIQWTSAFAAVLHWIFGLKCYNYSATLNCFNAFEACL